MLVVVLSVLFVLDILILIVALNLLRKIVGKNLKWSLIIAGITFIMFVPAVMALLMKKAPIFSVAPGGIEEWIPFWGSYFGGIIGFAGVLFTTIYIVDKSTKNVEKQLEEQEKQHTEQMKKQEEQFKSQLSQNRSFYTFEQIEKRKERLLFELKELKNQWYYYQWELKKYTEVYTKLNQVVENEEKYNAYAEKANKKLLQLNKVSVNYEFQEALFINYLFSYSRQCGIKNADIFVNRLIKVGVEADCMYQRIHKKVHNFMILAEEEGPECKEDEEQAFQTFQNMYLKVKEIDIEARRVIEDFIKIIL